MTYLRYKDYLGTIEPELESNTLFGKLAFIRDTVTYEATTLKELEVGSVDEYLLSCEELGREAHLILELVRRCIEKPLLQLKAKV